MIVSDVCCNHAFQPSSLSFLLSDSFSLAFSFFVGSFIRFASHYGSSYYTCHTQGNSQKFFFLNNASSLAGLHTSFMFFYSLLSSVIDSPFTLQAGQDCILPVSFVLLCLSHKIRLFSLHVFGKASFPLQTKTTVTVKMSNVRRNVTV